MQFLRSIAYYHCHFHVITLIHISLFIYWVHFSPSFSPCPLCPIFISLLPSLSSSLSLACPFLVPVAPLSLFTSIHLPPFHLFLSFFPYFPIFLKYIFQGPSKKCPGSSLYSIVHEGQICSFTFSLICHMSFHMSFISFICHIVNVIIYVIIYLSGIHCHLMVLLSYVHSTLMS